MINEFVEAGQTEIQLVVFQLGNEEYAVPITCVQEIIMPQPLTRIPKAPGFVEGVINLRGHIIPIIDGVKRFQLELKSKCDSGESRIIVLELESEIVGLIVDTVSEVIHLNVNDIEPPPIDMGEGSDFIWGVGKYQNRLLILLNPKKFLTVCEAKDIQKLAKVTEVIKNAKDVMISEASVNK